MKNLFKLSLIVFLIIFIFNSCSKDDYDIIKQESQLKILSKDRIENAELENMVNESLSKIEKIFEIMPPRSYKKEENYRRNNDSINLNGISINTEAYNIIEKEDALSTYIFEVEYPSVNILDKEIVNLHIYYDENNQLQSQLIKYDFTSIELETIKNNNSYDGYWDKLSYVNLSRGCPCQAGNTTPTPTWIPYPNNSGYGGSSPSAPYALPPLSTLPPHVMASLFAAGAIYHTNPSFLPGGNPSYTFPVQYFSVNDITIPTQNSSYSATPFNNFYPYYFSDIKNVIKNYYERVYVPQLNSYVTSTQTTLTDHIVKQKFIYEFFQFTYTLQLQNPITFNYLSANPTIIGDIFNYLNKNQTSYGTINVNAIQFINMLISYNDLSNINQTNTFIQWSINYRNNKPNVTNEQFQNWFMTPRENIDLLGYDSAYWENPSLTFPQQNLPSWNDYDVAFPRVSGADLVQTVGGAVQTAYNQYPSLSRGYCALKVSRALNYSGVNIPQITTTSGNPGTIQGSDGKYYFLNAKALNKWMRETFGTNPATSTTPLNNNHYNFTATQGGTNGENFPDLVNGLKGIFSMVSTNPNWASGHADLIEDGICVSGCHFQDIPPAPIDYIDIWVLN
jgi:hypothetical protein